MTDFLSPALALSRLRWLGAMLLVLLAWLGLGSLVSLALMQYWQVTLLSGDPLLLFLAIHAGFLCFALALLLVQRTLLCQPLHNLWSQGSFSWTRFFQGLGLWLALLVLAAGLEALLFPGSIQFQAYSAPQFHYALWVLLLTPVQAAAEEIFFRGLLLRMFYRFWQSPAVALVLSALCFTAVHLQNPEVNTPEAWLVLGYYFLFALLAGLLVLSDRGLERALGWHVGNNYFAFLFLSYDLSVIRTPALFHSARFDPAWNLAQFLLLVLISCMILFRTAGRQA